jgi:uncharacterized protein GlcG (DUF336 family)
MKLETAQTIVAAAVAHARAQKMKPLAVAVMDARGAIRALAAEDGTSRGRAKIAIGKANGAIEMGLGSRALAKRAEQMPQFIAALDNALGGLIPVPGGVLARDGSGEIVGAVGISGDTSENDEACALAGVRAAGLMPDTGA